MGAMMIRYLLDADSRVVRAMRPWERPTPDMVVATSAIRVNVGEVFPAARPAFPDAKDRGPISLPRADVERVLRAAGPTPLRHFLAGIFSAGSLADVEPSVVTGTDQRLHLWADDATLARLRDEAAARSIPMRPLLRALIFAAVPPDAP
jgi:hypothetical protein